MHGVAERIEDRRHVEWNAFVMAPDVGHRKRDEFRKRARPVHAHALGMRAQMAPAGETVAAAAADYMALAADEIAREEVRNVGADFHDLPHEFVPDGHRYGDGLLRPSVPFVIDR